jgi:hypothetical protein
MLIRFAGAIGVILTLTVPILGVLSDASAASIIIRPKSIVCDVTLATGGNPETDDFVSCAVNIKEIKGFCKNPAFGSAVESNGKPFTVTAFASATSTGDWTKTANGNAQQEIVITNQKIQESFDVYNSQNSKPFVFLKTTQVLCKRGWNSLGYFVTKADGVLADAKVPSLQIDQEVVATGRTSYFHETPSLCSTAVVSSASGVPIPSPLPTNCKCVAIPNWNFIWGAGGESGVGDGSWNGSSYVYVKQCDFMGDPFRYCSRFTDPQTSPSRALADSGLRIYDYTGYAGHNGQVVPVNDSVYKLKNCYLWRDVNKNDNFSLTAFGLYDPDTANIIPPQYGGNTFKIKGVTITEDQMGGFVLRNVSSTEGAENFYTGECHQHGFENTGGNNVYSWNQQGPAKTLINTDDTLNIRDPLCQGSSQTMDGTYDDGILP